MKYFVAENTGKGFITHEDNQLSHISGYPGNVWYTGDIQTTWAARVGAVEKTKEEQVKKFVQTRTDTIIKQKIDVNKNNGKVYEFAYESVKKEFGKIFGDENIIDE